MQAPMPCRCRRTIHRDDRSRGAQTKGRNHNRSPAAPPMRKFSPHLKQDLRRRQLLQNAATDDPKPSSTARTVFDFAAFSFRRHAILSTRATTRFRYGKSFRHQRGAGIRLTPRTPRVRRSKTNPKRKPSSIRSDQPWQHKADRLQCARRFATVLHDVVFLTWIAKTAPVAIEITAAPSRSQSEPSLEPQYTFCCRQHQRLMFL